MSPELRLGRGDARFLTVPGYTGSGPTHWQTLWEAKVPGFRRVEQRDWDRPSRAEWVEALEAEVRATGPHVVLVAHSLGCATVAHWAAVTGRPDGVLGAMLVAPADVDDAEWPAEVTGFSPMPSSRLPFPSVVVASRNDEWVTLDRARAFAEAWGADVVDVGSKGHLDSASGLADWPEGLMILGRHVRLWRDDDG